MCAFIVTWTGRAVFYKLLLYTVDRIGSGRILFLSVWSILTGIDEESGRSPEIKTPHGRPTEEVVVSRSHKKACE